MTDRKKIMGWMIQRLSPNSLVGETTLSELEDAGLRKIQDTKPSEGCRNLIFEDPQTGRHVIFCVRTVKEWKRVYKDRQLPAGGPAEDEAWAFHGGGAMHGMALFLGVTKMASIPRNMTPVQFHNQLIEDMRKEL